jgi:hypothetical protein
MSKGLERVEFYATPIQLTRLQTDGYTMTQRIGTSAVCEGWVTDSNQFTELLRDLS